MINVRIVHALIKNILIDIYIQPTYTNDYYNDNYLLTR